MLIRRATGRYKGTKFYWVGKGVGVAHSTVWISRRAKTSGRKEFDEGELEIELLATTPALYSTVPPTSFS